MHGDSGMALLPAALSTQMEDIQLRQVGKSGGAAGVIVPGGQKVSIMRISHSNMHVVEFTISGPSEFRKI
jgi:hypothetical protein